MKAIQNFVSRDNKTTPYVVVFVHGYNEHGYSVWFPLWNYIQDANIRAAFVRLDYRGSIRTNAADLTEQLKDIVTYYGVDNVIVVCHSKGGLDIQGAICYNNADTLLRYVVTLSTPHWGTPLCDLIDSDLSVFKNIQKQAKNAATTDMKVLRCQRRYRTRTFSVETEQYSYRYDTVFSFRNTQSQQRLDYFETVPSRYSTDRREHDTERLQIRLHNVRYLSSDRPRCLIYRLRVLCKNNIPRTVRYTRRHRLLDLFPTKKIEEKVLVTFVQ